MLEGLPLWFLITNAALLGAIWGSFAAALCERWPKGESISVGRSHCDHCATTLSARDLIPVVSFLWLRGKCRHCSTPIPRAAIGTEMAAIALGVIPFVALPPDQALGAALLAWALLPLIILDARHFWLPDRLVLSLALLGLAFGPLLNPATDFADRMIGAVGGFVVLEAIRRAFRYLRGVEGMGAGDPKLLAALAIWFGWQQLPFIILAASLLGLLFFAITRNHRGKSLPFGSYLGLSSVLVAWLM